MTSEESDVQRQPYESPKLVVFGSVKQLTAGSSGTIPDGGGSSMEMKFSDRRVKQKIVEIGRHPAGFGLYLFEYADELQAEFGPGRHFGVMADEIEALIPDAVSVGPAGYKRVDYRRIGVEPYI